MRSFVFDFDEEEAAGGSGGAGGGAVAGGEDVGDGVGGDAAAAGFDEGADEIADHVVEEAVAGDAVDEEVVLLVPGGVVDGADESGEGVGIGAAVAGSANSLRVVRSGSAAAKEVKS